MPSVQGAFKQKSSKSLEQEIFLLHQFFLVAKINTAPKFSNSIVLLLDVALARQMQYSFANSNILYQIPMCIVCWTVMLFAAHAY